MPTNRKFLVSAKFADADGCPAVLAARTASNPPRGLLLKIEANKKMSACEVFFPSLNAANRQLEAADFVSALRSAKREPIEIGSALRMAGAVPGSEPGSLADRGTSRNSAKIYPRNGHYDRPLAILGLSCRS